ncbi:hypothetical protein BD309DRAFT_947597 [Dichomitus squalens]|uniref:Uncharacterized protein n=2 Tax=Dichomitus squalens TaxID=114155 RepID=A0A4Q9P6N1_9APHY|nr:uncharacterized protein DICSQDRAFT_106134 [Dichomitus squalens LYAD-421 SS1]EJF61145.1 hypothetical protein DICSQDRAFT_106134 [Dichomitus squalens LYAD-421 SS1]TBU49395.1 hypothetical protein BD309DRAFT_947597 [Dichomitus squalens]TBU64007.1 hypothetical protein BD310DRAFT_973051 [Dichomitus squalens]
MSSSDDHDELPVVHINIPRRYYLLPGAAVLTGVTIGLFRGSRTASLRFLAENAHRTPKTVRGWYLYNKTKNYRVTLGGLKEAGADATKLGLTAAAWVAIEEGCTRLGLDDVREVAAGLGTGTLFGAVYRLPWTAFRRTTVLGVLIGGVLRALRWSKEYLEEQVQTRALAAKAVTTEGQEGVAGDTRDVVDAKNG